VAGEHLQQAVQALRAAQWGEIMRMATVCRLRVTYDGSTGNVRVEAASGGHVASMAGDLDHVLRSVLEQTAAWVATSAPDWQREQVR
jgi:hypothetical protein